MIRIDNKALCSGCGVCLLVCPNNCITFKKDSLGSQYAFANKKTCIDCGACQTVCPIQQPFNSRLIGSDVFASYSKDNNIRFRGSSGGIFETIGSWIINQNGSVFASRFDESLQLKMIEATTIDDVRKLTKSKYVQSESAYIFPTIKERVNQGKKVLVCSTPCQIAALKKYLGRQNISESLFLLDFFCHGVPSQELFNNCIDYVERKERIKIQNFEFRSKKRKGATPHYYTINYSKNGKEKQKTELYLRNPFYLGYQKYITFRDSCYQCPYGVGNHAGDLTIGDFHGIDKYIDGINRFDGVSTVIINSKKGELLWENIKDSMIVHHMDIERLYSDKQIYSGSTFKPARRDEFVNDMERLPFDQVVDKWFNSRREWIKILYYGLPSFIRKCVKSLVRL